MATLRQLTKAEDRKTKKRKLIIAGVAASAHASLVYRQALDALIKRMNRQVKSEILPLLAAREDSFLAVNDATDDILILKKQIRKRMKSIRKDFININRFARRTAKRHARLVEGANLGALSDKFNRELGVDVGEVLEKESLTSVINKSIVENVKLIKSVPIEFFERVEKTVLTGVTQGKSVRQIQREIFTTGKNAKVVGDLGITQRRAKLIAVDQTNKLNGAITMRRQLALGIKQYEWRTVGDNRVRPAHRELNGQIFDWVGGNQPPDGLHPGQPIRCRCQAKAIIPASFL